MTDGSLTQWEELDNAFSLTITDGRECQWWCALSPDTYDGLRCEMVLQIAYTIIRARLVEQFGQVMGWRIWNRWMYRRAGLRI